MKQNERIIKTGDYYEIQTIEDLMLQQKIPKKEDPQSSTNIPLPNNNIVTELPPRREALNAYFVPASSVVRVQDMGLNQHQSALEELLKQPIRDEERLEIEKLLKQITQIKNDGQLPLNKVPQHQSASKAENAKGVPKEISLSTELNLQPIEKQVKEMENLNFMELGKLEHLVDILLGEIKHDSQAPQASQLDEKVRAEIEATYNNLNPLTCLKSLPAILNKLSANEIKYVEMSEWVTATQETSDLNKQILDQFDHDELVLNQLEQSFKANAEAVRSVIKKLNE